MNKIKELRKEKKENWPEDKDLQILYFFLEKNSRKNLHLW